MTKLFRAKALPRFSKSLRFKSIFSFLIVCAFLQIHFTGCGSQRKTTTIKLWEYPRWRKTEQALDRFYWIKRQIREFERLHPGVSVELTELTWEHGEDKKKIAVSAGVGPDIITGTLPVQFVENGLLEPIDPFLSTEERTDFLSPALESFSYDGVLYGWPWYVTGSVIFANADLLDSRGSSVPDGNWSETEFLELAKRLTRPESEGRPASYGFAFLINPGNTAVWPFLFPEGAPLFSDDGCLSDSFAHPNIGFLSDLSNKYHVTPPFCAAWDAETLWQHFTARRDIAFIPLGIWAIPRLRALGDFHFDVLPYPSFDQSRTAAPAFIGTSGFMVLRQSDPKKRRLCMEFARFLVRPEVQQDLAKYGVIPSRISTGNIYEGDQVMSKVQRILSKGQAVPRHPQWAKIDEKFQRELQLALLGKKPITAAISETERIISGDTIKGNRVPTATPAAQKRATSPAKKVAFLIFAVAALCILVFVFRRWRRTQAASAFLFLLPALLIFAVFLLLPLMQVFSLTFQNYTFLQARPNWVGLQNLRTAIFDPVFRRSALNTFLYALVVVPANVLSALVVASLIHPLSKRMRGFFRGAYYLPGIMSVVVITMAWRWMFNENFGILNGALTFFGLPGVRWLTDTRVALWSVVLTSIARPPGGPVLIYLAALEAIPKSLYDAGELDGAGAVRRWWHITVPLLRPTTLFLALTITIASFQVFTQVFILTDGGPGYATEVVAHRIYTAAIRDFDFGVAAAMSLLLFIVIMLASIVQYKFFKSETEY